MTKASSFPASLEMLDRTFHLLRQTKAQTWSVYACCSAPFYLLCISLLQSLRADQYQSLTPETLFPLAAAFLFYGAGRSEFARRCHDALRGYTSSPIPNGRTLANHVLLHVTELAILPFGLCSILGFPFLLAALRSFLCTQDASLRRSLSRSFQTASRMYRHSSVMAVLLFVMAAAIFLNLLLAMFLLPTLWKSFTGLETEFTRNPALLFNATGITALAGGTGLLLDTFSLSFYALVLYQEEVQTTGRDLLQSLKMLEQGEEVSVP